MTCSTEDLNRRLSVVKLASIGLLNHLIDIKILQKNGQVPDLTPTSVETHLITERLSGATPLTQMLSGSTVRR
jgi:hypothetical protein